MNSIALIGLLLGFGSLANSAAVTAPYKAGVRIHPFANIEQSSFAWTEGATVSIEFGFVPGFDRLYFDYEGKFPITGSFNEQNGVLYLSGQATASEYTNAIAAVVFFTASRDGNPRRITWSLGKNTFYFSLTNHYYTFTQKQVSWHAARTACAATTFFGMQGYLATSTSADEQAGLSMKATFSAWLGGNDLGAYNEFRWMTGPEANGTTGTLFWTGPSQYAGGQTTQGMYSAWNRFQPLNPLGSGTDFMYLVNSLDQGTSYWAVAKSTDNIDGYICEYGSPTGDASRDVMSGSTQLVLGCNFFVAQSDCQNHENFGCKWQNGACAQGSCRQHLSQSACEVDWKCQWNVDGPVGVCSATSCSVYGGADTCALDPTCTVIRGTCKVAMCSDKLRACDCNQLAGCSWRGGICGSDETLNCNNTDIVVVFDGSSSMNTEFGRYTDGYMGLVSMLTGTQFSLSGIARGVVPAPNATGQRVGFVQFANTSRAANPFLTGVRDEILSDLSYLGGNQLASPGRVVGPALQKANAMFTSPRRNRVVVVISSGFIVDAQSLATKASGGQGILSEMLTAGVKIVGVALNSASAETAGGAAAMSSLLNLSPYVVSSVIRDVPSKVFYAMCDMDNVTQTSLARYTLPSAATRELCNAYSDRGTCARDAKCAWDPALELCLNSVCMNSCDQGTCEANAACLWQAEKAQCVQVCQTLNETRCESYNGNATCHYNFVKESCENAVCVTNPNEDACIADPARCAWNPALSIPCYKRPCDTNDQNACTSMAGCSWNGETCFRDECRQQTTQQTCLALKQCDYNQATGACTTNLCGQHLSERDCSVDFMCQWDTTQSPSACTPAPCTYLNSDPSTAQSICIANPSCLWSTRADNGQRDMCLPRMCDLMRRSCDCAAVEGCVWRNNTCKDDPFVQCPATDVVFLIEATSIMAEGFGRHPNGFVGIVEAIRTWAEEAPFSPQLDSTGFRVAVIGYGQGSPLSVLAGGSVGSGGNLTNQLQKIIGANEELDTIETMQPTYGDSGQSGNVLIRPALQKAYDIFTTSQNPMPPRKRVMVILGHSPITDQSLSGDITKLETLGVSIFANILRRFSDVVPSDVTAANFMRPLASDPPSEFFMFTTVDGMREQLLEKFCDPTTGTGKVLGISRNGELPCSWLTGADECTIQGSCMYDPKATMQCPLPDQCPSLGCRTLPPALAAKFDCHHCHLVAGDAIDCSRSKIYQAQPGQCVKSNCSKKCESGTASCASTAGCSWVAASSRCERDMCSGFATQTACNGNFSCVWEMNVLENNGQGTCIKSMCGRLRDTATCNGATITEEVQAGISNTYSPCMLDTSQTPALCVQQRCPQLQQGSCDASLTNNRRECEWDQNAPGTRKCETIACRLHTDAAVCQYDSRCYWNSYSQSCHDLSRRGSSCVLTGYSDWAPCSASCGPAVTYKTRSVVLFNEAGGQTCGEIAEQGCGSNRSRVANCDSRNQDPGYSGSEAGDRTVTVVRTCQRPPEPFHDWVPAFPGLPTGDWPLNCTVHCQGITDRQTCIMDSSCRWVGNTRCVVKPFMGCQTLEETAQNGQPACGDTDMCAWDSVRQICEPSMTVCPFTSQDSCNNVFTCHWRTGQTALQAASALNVPVQLYNPGQKAIFPFDTLHAAHTDYITGATVTIESNYQRGKDVLTSTQNQVVKSQWLEQSGTLLLSGNATVADYMLAIRFVSFQTTSTRTTRRTITWSLGHETVYSTFTGHHYQYVENMGSFYSFALSSCTAKNLHGMTGYLATITSEQENDLIFSKLFAAGWISGSDANGNIWSLTSGNNTELNRQFWRGPSGILGGRSVNGQYANWAPPNLTNPSGEPLLNQGVGGTTGIDRLYLSRSGYWESRPLDTDNVEGFICEFGGMPTDTVPPYPLGGAAMVGIGGCVAEACVWHQTETDCTRDVECAWNGGVCEAGCATRATEAECSSSSRCKWDTSQLPPACILDICAPLSVQACAVANECEWDPVRQCVFKQGCGQYGHDTCDDFPQCAWQGSRCGDRGCSTYTSAQTCRASPMCSWDSSRSACVDAFCKFPAEQLCNANADRCVWNTPTSLQVGFAPGGSWIHPLATNLPIPGDIASFVDGVTVSIQSGFQANADVLNVDPAANVDQNWEISYSATNGVLTMKVVPGVQMRTIDAFNFMKSSVRFMSTSNANVRRQISYVIGFNMVYSVTTKRFFKWRQTPRPTSFADAQQACAVPWFGLAGHLAVLATEYDNLAVRQMAPSGWISAQGDAQSEWSWVNPDGSSTAFWRGLASRGMPINLPVTSALLNNSLATYFAQWNVGEPAIAPGFAYMNNRGFWKAIPASPNLPGVICMYGNENERPRFSVSGVRNVVPEGCFPGECLTLAESDCNRQASCRWHDPVGNRPGRCALDTRCQSGRNPDLCSRLQSCFWDYSTGVCSAEPPNVCSVMDNPVNCSQTNGCEWNAALLPTEPNRGLGACVFTGCRVNPVKSACQARPTCKWAGDNGPCIERLCGYQTVDSCWRDAQCVWVSNASQQGCRPSPCLWINTSATCGSTDSCTWDAAQNQCAYARCSTTAGMDVCLQDKGCLYLSGRCQRPNCNPTAAQATCDANPQCFFFTETRRCDAAQCISYQSLAACEQGQTVLALKPCIWDDDSCRQPTYAEQNAPQRTNTCAKQTNPNMWWLWMFLAIILILLGIIIHRLYLAHASGRSFFEPTRKNFKYNPHEQYATELFDDARQTGVETNDGY